ncbi:MAG TPA: hypothetical protein ENK08_11940 [Chloroflexi bacterium]|nr:hypothetical protein [Chloroflexota bacterium]
MRASSRWASVLILVLAGVVGAAYLVTAFTAAGGRVVAPLDDAYITFQYARQMARGHPYEYNDGDPPTTGMTSPLFGAVLAGAYFLGFTGEWLVGLALGMGVVWLGATGWLTYRLVRQLLDDRRGSERWAMTAAAFVLLSGPVEWGGFNGMETGLFAVLSLAALGAFLEDRIGRSALWLGLAGLTRPEGLILAGLAWAVALVGDLASRRGVRQERMVPFSLAVVAGLIPLLVHWALTGTTAATGLQAKSWLFNEPRCPEMIARSILGFYRTILFERFLGWGATGAWFVPPGFLLFVVLGWGALAAQHRWKPLGLTLSWFLLGTLSSATLITAVWQYGRYQVAFIPVAAALLFGGLAFLRERLGAGWRFPVRIVALLLLVASAGSGLRALRVYRQAVETMTHQQLVIADWLRERLPPGVRVGIHDAGSLRYVGEHPTYDLIGLTTAGAALAWRNGPGSVFEQMEHSPLRPDDFAIYPDVVSTPYLLSTSLFAERLFRVEVRDYGVPSGGPVQEVWRADWHLAGSGDRFYQQDVLSRTFGLKLVDALDVADLADEEAHNVRWWEEPCVSGFPTEVWQMTYRVPPHQEVLDGGRLLTGGVAFDVATDPGESLWIVARLHAQEPGAVRVEVNGGDAGRWAYPPVPGEWLETVFRVPAEHITSAETHLVLSVEDSHRYAPYYFWFLQGEPEMPAPRIERTVDAAFGDRLRLLGFDLPARVGRPGGVISVTLYWQASAATDSGAKVFLHLYDADGNLVSQSDGWAYYDTRPPYTWWPGEVVADPRRLTLPEDLEPGRYSIGVGLYTPDAPRLPAYREGVRQPEDRVILGTLEVSR